MEEKVEKEFTILGKSIWRIMSYFVIYSVLGFIIETLYGLVSKGLLESRQSFLYGPFCAIYGVGACVLILFLHRFKSHNYQFLGGFFIGAIVEYLVSYFCEMILHVKWWDYSNQPFNINGRVCIAFSVFWGILSIYLIGYLNPKVDKLIDKIKSKFSIKKLKILVTSVLLIMLIDCILTIVAIYCFQVRKIEQHNLNVENKEQVSRMYEFIYGNEQLSRFIYKFWHDEKMIITFPNLKIQDKDGNMIYFDSLVPHAKRYYYVLYEKDFN